MKVTCEHCQGELSHLNAIEADGEDGTEYYCIPCYESGEADYLADMPLAFPAGYDWKPIC